MSIQTTILASPVPSADVFNLIKAELANAGETEAEPAHMTLVKVAILRNIKNGAETLAHLKGKIPDVTFEYDSTATIC